MRARIVKVEKYAGTTTRALLLHVLVEGSDEELEVYGEEAVALGKSHAIVSLPQEAQVDG